VIDCAKEINFWTIGLRLICWLPWGSPWETPLGHRNILLYGGTVFADWNNAFLTPQLGQKTCMRFVRVTRVSRGSCSNSDFFLGSPVGHRMKFIPGKNRFGANVSFHCPFQ
jgi:hypothetical protein